MTMQDVIGVDISKDHLDAYYAGSGEHRRFSNDKVGLLALCRWPRGRGDVLTVFEASGAYHRDLEQALARETLPFAKVNPRQARRFAEAIGQVAKTDRVDAMVLARMGGTLHLTSRAPISEHLAELQDLLVFRRGLIRDRTAAQTRLKTARPTLLRRLLGQRLAQIERQVASVDRAMQTIIDADPDLYARRDILVSIPGISTVSATAILVDMPELGGMDGKQAAALAGLAPMSRQSGRWQGQERIQGGRSAVRRALFTPALSAIQHNRPAKKRFQQLVDAGKPRKVALTAVMRKLIVTANALFRDGRKWSEQHP
ncbi:MAG: IS110 family transposase [Pseudomonadota bacterium]